ncbi:LacI family DNA-binding transcriptional regulator [Hoyosella subflava]|uniref:Transcriptional regulator, LacI family protein n=1 Tax=Hoyosella subflava (strain DSM 45089 / JCM 17490 / NBRC 109087 / DQS3-9A1) TaxID=443218 RepID=F6EES7_HOYSD|nr:LacI family DNA-binding transcriptional regulator [Hoyosella subflava]AEF40877.1 Transcriptional regulator, LacI family protein [Hoyosella subflava DQS3-9A1]
MKRPTLVTVAQRAGVSTALASIVMRGAKGASEQTRVRVLEAAREVGYQPDARARMLRQRHTRLIGVQFDLQQAFHGDLVEGIYAAAEQAGYDVALSAVTPARGEDRAVQSLLAHRCDGLILLGPQQSPDRLNELGQQLPIVSVARRLRGKAAETVDVVRSADDIGVHQAVTHLTALGHQHIAQIDGGKAPGAADRRRGFMTAMRRSGLAQGAIVLSGGADEEQGARVAREILALSPRPTAVIAFNDRCAVGVLDVFLREGISVPGDISVVGYDDSRLASMSHVDLTTVGQDASELARIAVERAIGRIEGAADINDREIVFEPHLVVRGTTGPAHVRI